MLYVFMKSRDLIFTITAFSARFILYVIISIIYTTSLILCDID